MLRTSRKPVLLAMVWFAAAWCLPLRAGIAEQVRLDFFFSPGCSECERVKREVLPGLEERFADFYEIVWHDMNEAETIPLLIAYQDRCRNHENGLVSIIVDHTVFLSGYESISAGLLDRVNEALARRQSPGWRPPEPPPRMTTAEQRDVVQARASAMTISIVAIGGLTDGFNPCAISTLIFFLSLLTVLKVTKRTRLLVGISFIAASFLVYTGLGLGFFFAIRRVPNFHAFKKYVEIAVGLGMIPLAVLSFRDAFRFKKSGRANDVTLQIPTGIKTRIHAVMRSGLGFGGPVISGFLIGAAVTILESVCTGQGYLPVLMYLVKNDTSRLYAWLLLVLYNLLFVLPLAVVFICFHRGMQINRLTDWSRRNLVVVKVILGVFFSAIAILLTKDVLGHLLARW
jgi:cytochrome c biogenesis protein CcdA